MVLKEILNLIFFTHIILFFFLFFLLYGSTAHWALAAFQFLNLIHSR
jgi:hypothetical protein